MRTAQWPERASVMLFVNVLDKMFCEKQFKSRMSIAFGSDDNDDAPLMVNDLVRVACILSVRYVPL